MPEKIKVLVWNEYRDEKKKPEAGRIYPQGIHRAIADSLQQQADMDVATAVLDQPEHGLTVEALQNTDVLIWWGHSAHAEVQDRIVERVQERVLEGMGLIALHAAQGAKIFKRLIGIGSGCRLKWREAGEKERIWVIEPGHPIAAGLPDYIELPQEEMYGERFDIPPPQELVFISWFAGGEVFRSGCCFSRGLGRIFYFQPGHETYPVYHDANIMRVIVNAVRWAAPTGGPRPGFGQSPHPLEPLGG